MKTVNYFFGYFTHKRLGSLVAFIVAFTFSTVTFAQSTKADFSGKWILNTEKSQPVSSGDAKAMYIVQNNDTITIQYIFTGEGGEDYTSDYSFVIDGSISTEYDEWGWEEFVAVWSESGKTIKISSTYYDEEYEDMDEYSWDEFEISEDLKTLTTRHTEDLSTYSVRVYDKEVN
jgi:hypothetical protein